MFEFEEAGGLHDVFLNRHAVSSWKNIFINFERQMYNKKIPRWTTRRLRH